MMTISETKKLLITINALYPAWKIENPEATAKAWHWALADYPADKINAALQVFIKTDKGGFAPSPSQLIAAMKTVRHNNEMNEGEAWALVKRAIGDSAYHAQERFDELPEVVQKAVGNPSMLRQWGMCDSTDVNTVIMSNFQRAYKAELSRKEFKESIPRNLIDVIEGITERIEANG